MGYSCAARETENRTPGPGGFVCLRVRQEAALLFARWNNSPRMGSSCLDRAAKKRSFDSSAIISIRSLMQSVFRRRLVPHQFRHTYASEMLRAGVGLPAFMNLLGHVDPDMTMRYLDVTLTDLTPVRASACTGSISAHPDRRRHATHLDRLSNRLIKILPKPKASSTARIGQRLML